MLPRATQMTFLKSLLCDLYPALFARTANSCADSVRPSFFMMSNRTDRNDGWPLLVPVADAERELGRADRNRRGAARLRIDQRHFAEDLAAGNRLDDPAALADLDLAASHDVGRIAAVALDEDDTAVGEIAGLAGNLLKELIRRSQHQPPKPEKVART